jgi:hypothetical protein
MMKEACVKQLGGQLGRYMKIDSRYPGYLRTRVDFPLSKPLVPKLTIKIRGKGNMEILEKYENVPHFCFTCGRICHAATNCEEGNSVDQGINFAKELKAPPPRRTREISVPQGLSKASKSLFTTGLHQVPSLTRGHGGVPGGGASKGNMAYLGRPNQKIDQFPHTAQNQGLQHFISGLADGVKEMTVEGIVAKEIKHNNEQREGK